MVLHAMPKQIQPIIRAGYSPAEFAGLFGKHPCWTYRQLYAGKVHAVTTLGRILIPASEVERILAPAEPYNPRPKPKRAPAAAVTHREGTRARYDQAAIGEEGRGND